MSELQQKLRWGAARARFDLRKRLEHDIAVRDGDETYVFRCRSLDEYVRAESFHYKEKGTVALLRDELEAGDVFCDVGANIGIYTIPAAKHVGPAGRIYAFEPHAGNLVSLLENIALNGVSDRVSVLSCALHDATRVSDFRYTDLGAGTSMSQFESERDAFGRAVSPVALELKYAATLDDLIDSDVVRPPGLVKIDVDGNELLVLRGMRRLLAGESSPRAIQVEVNPDERDELMAFMTDARFDLASRHYTEGAERMLEAGMSEERVPFNGVFRPATPR